MKVGDIVKLIQKACDDDKSFILPHLKTKRIETSQFLLHKTGTCDTISKPRLILYIYYMLHKK